jgi:hypothetical protein
MMVAQSAQMLQDVVQADGVLLSLAPPDTDAGRTAWGGKGAG